MLGGRRKLPVLAEISGPDSDPTRVFSLRRDDLERLADLREDLTRRACLLVTGGEDVARTVAVAVAGVSCAAGRRVVLVDCDLAKPRLAADLGLAEAPGVHEYLRWEATAPELLQPVALAGPASAGAGAPLAVIAAGRQAPDPRRPARPGELPPHGRETPQRLRPGRARRPAARAPAARCRRWRRRPTRCSPALRRSNRAVAPAAPPARRSGRCPPTRSARSSSASPAWLPRGRSGRGRRRAALASSSLGPPPSGRSRRRGDLRRAASARSPARAPPPRRGRRRSAPGRRRG